MLILSLATRLAHKLSSMLSIPIPQEDFYPSLISLLPLPNSLAAPRHQGCKWLRHLPAKTALQSLATGLFPSIGLQGAKPLAWVQGCALVIPSPLPRRRQAAYFQCSVSNFELFTCRTERSKIAIFQNNTLNNSCR
jgi:hypothetical protein